MLGMEEWMDIKVLHKQGESIRAIAKQTGYSRNTIRQVLRGGKPPEKRKRERGSKLDEYKEYIKGRYESCGLSAVRLMEELREKGYEGSVVTVRRYLAELRPRRRGMEKLTVRYETEAGKQGQVDWAYCGKFAVGTGEVMAIYAFVFVLGYSRQMYVEFTTSMRVEELVECHVRAFEYFGGWPETILYDNMKQVKLEAGKWHPVFVDFVTHYGIVAKTHRVRRPRTKGKVERMVDYVKDNFLNGREFVDVADLNRAGRKWLDEVANVRVHATTGERPCEAVKRENLTPLEAQAVYRVAYRVARKVSAESAVHYQESRYSVPPEYVGQQVVVEQAGERIVVRAGDVIIADHARAVRRGSWVAQPEHLEAVWKLSLCQPVSPVPSWKLTFDEVVSTTPLTVYEEVTR